MRKQIFCFALCAMLFALSFPVQAQQPTKIPRIGYLRHTAGPTAVDEAFRKALRDLGWIEGQNVAIEYRWAANKRERYPALAAELVRLKVDLIVVSTMLVTRAAKNATRTIPIVMAVAGDAVENGLVASLARPGGNVTGMSEQFSDVHAKLLELLHETLPKVTRVGFLWDPTSPVYVRTFTKAQAMAPALGLTIQSLALQGKDRRWRAEELESALEAAAQERAGALVVIGRMYSFLDGQSQSSQPKTGACVFHFGPLGGEAFRPASV